MPNRFVSRRRWRLLVPALSALLVLPATASATPLSATGGMTIFSAGNGTVTGNENDGSMAVGGDLVLPAGGDYRVGNNHASPYRIDGKPFALYVGGTVRFDGGRLTVNNNQYARVVDGAGLTGATSGGTASITRAGAGGAIALNTGQPASTMFGAPANAIDFTSAFVSLRAEADAYGALAPTVTPTNANGEALSWSGAGTVDPYLRLSPGTNVWRLTADQLERLGTITFRSMPSDATLVIAVPDWTSGTWRAPNFSGIGITQAKRILLAFPSATALTLEPSSATVEGTILAPRAAVSLLTRSNVEGSVIAASFSHTGGGEIHHAPFEGQLPDVTPTPTPSPEPTPSPTPSPEPSPSPTPSPEPTPSPTPTPSPEPTPSPTPSPEPTPTPFPQPTPASTPAPDATPVPATPAAVTATPVAQGGILGATETRRVGTAKLTGLAGCVKSTRTATVSGRSLRTVVFRVDGKKVRTVKATRNGTRAASKITVAPLTTGTHKLTARVTFTDGTKARTLTIRFSKCATGAVSPQFTG